jgi:hypothetical protein
MLADVRRAVIVRAIRTMNTSSVDGNPSPCDLVCKAPSASTGQSVLGDVPAAIETMGPAAPVLTQEDTSENAAEDWGSLSSRPIAWGRPNPPIHPDEGIEWSNISDRTARVDWDNRASSGSPPPKVLAPDLFSDRGDGFPLSHLRRKGENAETKTIAPEYMSSA